MTIRGSHNRRFLFALAVIAATLASCDGPTGPTGISGSPGLSGLQTISTEATIQNDAVVSLRAECPADKKVISGGFAAVGDGSQFVRPYQSFPISATAWVVAVHNSTFASIRVTAFAICASVT
jgi:hypothetical protein